MLMDFSDDLPSDRLAHEFQRLTAAQREAVEHVDGPLLILAGPGSGKTRVVTHRIAHMLSQGIPAQQIVALTFTNKAAEEMRNRVRQLAPGRAVWMGTFHGFCARLLRQHASLVGLSENYSIYDMDDARRALKQVLAEHHVELTHTSPDAIAKAIGWAKNNVITHEEYEPRAGHAVGAITARVYPEYQRFLVAANAVDFDDLLLHVACMLRDNSELRRTLDDHYRYILVDEYQDTNFAQYAIVRALSQDHPHLAVTGDPDQSIYGWRGANLNNILDFERDFPGVKVVRLEQNYRSTPNILRVADQLIAHNVRRKDKRLFTDKPAGEPVRLVFYETGRDEADAIADQIAREIDSGRRRARDFAVFYRINAMSRLFEHALRSRGIRYQIVHGLEFYQRKEIKDVMAYLQLLNNPRNEIALLRIINAPARGIGDKTIERLREHARRARLSLLDAARQCGLIATISKRTATSVANFVARYDRMAVEASGELRDVIECVLQESGYRDALLASGSDEDQERLANLEELLNAAAEFDAQHPEGNHLETFLEQSALVADVDAWDTENDQVTLMTMHAAKGLEFPVVYIVAVEEGLLPHERSREAAEKLEEERRLFFVGMTRAEEVLQLSLAQYRALRGERRPTVPSQFLMELPREEMSFVEAPMFQFEDLDHGQFHGDADEHLSDDDRAGNDDAGDISFDVDRFETESINQPVWSDDEICQDVPERMPVGSRRLGLRTAAEMLDDAPTRLRPSPNVFDRGMRVSHPEYGPGTIVSISGTGSKRTAVVAFFESGEQLTFRLTQSPLSILTD
jgi:DNA helicase-2/ATP-dependent DNA helicase PcrA